MTTPPTDRPRVYFRSVASQSRKQAAVDDLHLTAAAAALDGHLDSERSGPTAPPSDSLTSIAAASVVIIDVVARATVARREWRRRRRQLANASVPTEPTNNIMQSAASGYYRITRLRVHVDLISPESCPRYPSKRRISLVALAQHKSTRTSARMYCYVAPGSGAKYCDERVGMSVCPCLSVSHISKPRVQTSRNFLYMLTVAVSRSSSDDILCIDVTYLRMTACLPIIGQAKATPIRRILKVTHRDGSIGAKSDVCDYLVFSRVCLFVCVRLQTRQLLNQVLSVCTQVSGDIKLASTQCVCRETAGTRHDMAAELTQDALAVASPNGLISSHEMNCSY